MGSANIWGTYAIVWFLFLLLLLPSTVQASFFAAPSRDGTAYWLEAECATIGSRWTKVISEAAAGGAYVETQFVALASPPAATPENLIRFTVQNPPLTAFYTLYARVDAPSPGNDSYWLRINEGPWQEIKSGFRIGQGFQWVRLITTLLQDGTNTIDFTYRENSTRLDKILLTDTHMVPTGFGEPTQECPDVTPPPVDKGVFWLEAECAIVGSTWTPERDAAAANGILVTSTRSSNRFQPPLDVPGNYIRFAVEDPELTSGGYRIWIRANLPDANSSSFWIRFNGGDWSWRQPTRIQGRGLQWAGYPVGRNALQAGSNTIDITYGDAGVQLDKVLVTKYSIVPSFLGGPAAACTFTPAPTVSDRNTFWLEGECAEVGDEWSTEADPGASNSTAVVVRGAVATDAPPADEPVNFLRFNLAAADSGSYNLFARVKTPDNLSDSYYIRTNGGPWYEWARGFEFMDTYSWQQTPVAFTLQEGANTLDVAYREDGALLDKLFLTLTASEVTGDTLGNPATNCTSEAALAEVSENQLLIDRTPPTLSLFPNPTSSYLSLQWQSEVEGPVNLSITDARGRQVRSVVLSTTAGWLRQEVDVSVLPAGVYYLRILRDQQQIVRRFVKQ